MLSRLLDLGILGIVVKARILLLMDCLMMLLSRLLVSLVSIIGFLMLLIPTLRAINTVA